MSISPTFKSSFCADVLAPKKYKPKMKVQKGCAQIFCTKKSGEIDPRRPSSIAKNSNFSCLKYDVLDYKPKLKPYF